MKKILIGLIKLYQITPIRIHGLCKYNPTCSNYMIDALNEYGLIKGVFLGIKRILRCNPFSKGGYDPVIKKEKKMKKIITTILCVFFLTGCEFKGSTFDADSIKTSVYPIEYITSYLYGTIANVSSIYPDSANYNTYEFTDKLIEDYSSSDLFIYNGTSAEKKTAVKLLNNNSEIQIIDAMQGMAYKYGMEELWLDPSNFLMIASNIKNGLLKLNTNKYTAEKIEEKYSELKVSVSKLDVDFNTLASSSNYTTIVVSNDVFKYLTKYEINVIVLNKNNVSLNKSYSEVKTMAKSGKIKYIYTLKGEVISEELKSFIKDNNLTKIEIDSLAVISEKDRNNKEDYITIMNTTISQLKKELDK